MEPAKKFQDLIVWQKSHAFVLATYKLTNNFPKSELYGLTSQFRRAAVSIASNIAEGFRKKGKRDKARFFNIAQRSLEGCRYYLILANDLSYCNSKKMRDQIEEVSKLIDAYRKAILTSDSS